MGWNLKMKDKTKRPSKKNSNKYHREYYHNKLKNDPKFIEKKIAPTNIEIRTKAIIPSFISPPSVSYKDVFFVLFS